MAGEKVKRQALTYVAESSVVVDGVELQPGTYRGYMKQLGVHMFAGISWTNPEYYVVLSQSEMAKIPGYERYSGMELNADAAVASGALKII